MELRVNGVPFVLPFQRNGFAVFLPCSQNCSRLFLLFPGTFQGTTENPCKHWEEQKEHLFFFFMCGLSSSDLYLVTGGLAGQDLLNPCRAMCAALASVRLACCGSPRAEHQQPVMLFAMQV